jgi:ABC-type nitrate/sulfonate/bicarbonate transport system substrate-binding protein
MQTAGAQTIRGPKIRGPNASKEKTCRRKVALATLVALQAAVAGPALAGGALNVGKADAKASAIVPVNVAEKLGLFKKHGIEVKIADFTGGSKLSQAMVAGSIDIGVGAGTEMAFVAKGAPIIAVCDDTPPIPFIGIAVPWDSPIHSIADLKGKRIGISSAGSLTDWLARELAHHQGWGDDGVTRVAIGNGAAAVLAAFRTHAIDADISVTSNIFSWEENKEGRLLIPASQYVGNIAAGAIYATKHLIETDPDALRRFLAAWLETIAFINSHKAETVKLESAITGYSETVMSKEYDVTRGMFSKDCKFDPESLANLKRAFVEQKLVDSPPDMSKLYTEAFLPK